MYVGVVDWGLATVGLALLLVAAVSRRLSGTPITPAMVVVAIGVLVGPLVLDDLNVGPTSLTVRRLAEATLAVVLFSDSSRIDLRALRRELSLPVRLLGIGLPLTIALGALVALALFGSFSLSEALILGVILAPTDAGLGSAVVTDPSLPQRVRQSLNVESGLNDGICVPILLIVLATSSGAGGAVHPAQVIGEEIGYGLIGGIVAGAIGAGIVNTAGARRLIDDAWRPIIPVAAAVLAYGIAEALGGSGFIAAFTAGALFGLIARENSAGMMGFTEETGVLLDAVTFSRLRRHPARPRARARELADRALCRPEPDDCSHAARGPLSAGHKSASSDRGVHRLVRPTRARVDRVRSDRRGHTSGPRRDDPHGLLFDRGPLGPGARALGGAAREPLRRLVSSRGRRASPYDGERARARASRPGAQRAKGQSTRRPSLRHSLARACQSGRSLLMCGPDGHGTGVVAAPRRGSCRARRRSRARRPLVVRRAR